MQNSTPDSETKNMLTSFQRVVRLIVVTLLLFIGFIAIMNGRLSGFFFLAMGLLWLHPATNLARQ
jgi:hypothetical protein